MAYRALSVFALLIAATLPSVAPAADSCGDPSASALAVVDAYLDTFNAGDSAAHAATLQYPSYLVTAAGDVHGFPELAGYESMISDYTAPWHHELFDEKLVVRQSPSKVHVRVRITRYAEDNSVLGSHDSLWIVACREGRWGIVVRSTFVSHAGS